MNKHVSVISHGNIPRVGGWGCKIPSYSKKFCIVVELIFQSRFSVPVRFAMQLKKIEEGCPICLLFFNIVTMNREFGFLEGGEGVKHQLITRNQALYMGFAGVRTHNSCTSPPPPHYHHRDFKWQVSGTPVHVHRGLCFIFIKHKDVFT